MSRSEEFGSGYDRAKDWEADMPDENRRYTVVTHHGADRDNPEVRKKHFNTFLQAKSYGNSLAWPNSRDVIPNPNMNYGEKDGYAASFWGEGTSTSNKWGVILKSVKRNGRWVPDKGEY